MTTNMPITQVLAKLGIMIITAMTIVMVITACGRTSDSSTAEYKITIKSMSDSVKASDGIIVLSADVSYPCIENAEKDSVAESINTLYEDNAKYYIMNLVEEYGDEAIYMYNDGFNDTNYEFLIISSVTYNQDEILSIVQNISEYTGGAHPNNRQEAGVYNMTTGMLMSPEEIIGGTYEEVIADAKQLFLDEIHKSPENYYENATEIVNGYTEKMKYYVNDTGLVFYFNPYEIAPYAAGIQSITIPFPES